MVCTQLADFNFTQILFEALWEVWQVLQLCCTAPVCNLLFGKNEANALQALLGWRESDLASPFHLYFIHT